MNKSVASYCRVCGDPAELPQTRVGSTFEVHCKRCGNYKITDTCATILGDPSRDNALLNSDVKKASVGHWLRQQQRNNRLPLLEADIAEQHAKVPMFPSLHDQRETLLRLIADQAGGPGERVQFEGRAVQYKLGSRKPSAVQALVSELVDDGLMISQSTPMSHDDQQFSSALTYKGWLAYEDIHRGKTSGRHAFLMMPFDRPELDGTWLPRLHAAVLETGFGLNRVDGEARPGQVDIRARVQIRQARFLIVELTHAGPAAAWAAGFAEGLGKPVIYTCREGLAGPVDVEHALRITWSPERLDDAADRLKATIRNVLTDAA
jgi:hypothetical protein